MWECENQFDLHESGSVEETNFCIRKQKAKMIFKSLHPLRTYAMVNITWYVALFALVVTCFGHHPRGSRSHWVRNKNSDSENQETISAQNVPQRSFTAPFNNMRTLTFKAQPTNAFFATVSQVFGDSFQLPNTVERAVIKSLSTVQITKQSLAVVGS